MEQLQALMGTLQPGAGMILDFRAASHGLMPSVAHSAAPAGAGPVGAARAILPLQVG